MDRDFLNTFGSLAFKNEQTESEELRRENEMAWLADRSISAGSAVGLSVLATLFATFLLVFG